MCACVSVRACVCVYKCMCGCSVGSEIARDCETVCVFLLLLCMCI